MKSLTEFERELLERCATYMGETTTTLYEEVTDYHDRAVIEATLRGLVSRGFMTTSRGVFGGEQRLRDGSTEHQIYEDDWWTSTNEGRAAIGLPPPKPDRHWMRPSHWDRH
jgi:hypothetical protein